MYTLPGYTAAPDTAERRREGMRCFRAKMLASHERILAEMKQTGAYGGVKATRADIAQQEQCIATIRAAQAARIEGGV